MAEEIPVVVIDEKQTEAKVIYESDLRASPRRNGRAHHLVGAPQVGGGDDPPKTIEPEHEHRHLPEQPSRPKNVVLGLVYVGAGVVALSIGVLMLKDAFTGGKQ